jgi:hypothetical protein
MQPPAAGHIAVRQIQIRMAMVGVGKMLTPALFMDQHRMAVRAISLTA